MKTVTTRAELRSAIGAVRSSGDVIAVVPTMGALHEGHLSLVDVARAHAAFTVMTVFVNPLQFGPSEDLDEYPRDLERDASLARDRGVDLVFAPSSDLMYPNARPDVFVDAPGRTNRLCGASRPGHFRGVLTVVAKLFNLVQPDVAVFGRKDFMQLVLIRRMVADLDFPVRIVGAPIVRDHDGLALSSRNTYLSEDARRQALSLSGGLALAARAFDAGERSSNALIAIARAELDAQSLVDADYVEVVDPDSLDPVAQASPGDVMALAAVVAGTRLIDNIEFGAPDSTRSGALEQ